jgi:hypothetical protein
VRSACFSTRFALSRRHQESLPTAAPYCTFLCGCSCMQLHRCCHHQQRSLIGGCVYRSVRTSEDSIYHCAACDDILPARASCQQVERRHSRMMHQLLQLATAMLENGCNSLSGHNASWLCPAVSVAKFSRIREHAAGRYISPSGAPIPAGLSTLLS